MAKTKAQGAVKGNRDAIAKRLGVKLFGGQKAKPGAIIIRQRGSRVYSGMGTSMGRDFTIFALREGIVHFKSRFGRKFVEVVNG